MRLKLLCLAMLCAGFLFGQPAPTDLYLRGYSVIPSPQKVALHEGDVRIDESWTIDGPAGHIATRWLASDLASFHSLKLSGAAGRDQNVIALKVQPGAVAAAPTETASQAYHLDIREGRIQILANGDAGLLYGVQTLVQLIKADERGQLRLPVSEIDDWPRLKLRFLHWDTKHHQDRMPTLKRYIDWAVRFKANMIGFELEDKFSYPSHPEIGAPGAFTPAELQEIVNYGLERHMQVVPVVQSPAHMAYVLKHPEFARLKADGNNYQSDLCQEDTYKLIFEMYDDVIRATRGIDYFFVSTDEVYYAGIGKNCALPYNPANRSKAWADFAIRAHDHLAKQNRRMLAWVEYPLLDKDMARLPKDLIDGVVGEDGFFAIEKRNGMRQLIYTSTQGAEYLFPDHFAIESLPPGKVMGEFEAVFTAGRIGSLYNSITRSRVWELDPIGSFAAAWDDSGLHSETFWLGWSAVARWAWHPGVPGPEQHAAEFMNVYYGPRVQGMTELYRTMQRQARAWQRSWDRVTSRVRKPGYGNSEGPGIGTERQDFTLAAPALPDAATLAFQPVFSVKYKGLITESNALSLSNDQLQNEIFANIGRASRNQYNLEVFLTIARLTGHHWKMIGALAKAENDLAAAASAAKRKQPEAAVGHLVAAHNRVAQIEREAAAVQRYLTEVWEKDRYPKGRSVNGRTFLHVLDDTKDHWADRTADLGYMFYPEQSIGLAQWRKSLSGITAAYAKRNNVEVQGLAEARLED
ncbi:MAG: beta-N-acetylhexosaminidase [Bryobacterales bacterium]|nr:beta-N-acetylhexosaminidase [Bryobacterales bacterium]